MENNLTPDIQEEILPINNSPQPKRRSNWKYILTVLLWMGGFVGFQVAGALLYSVVTGVVSTVLYDDPLFLFNMDHMIFSCSVASAVLMSLVCVFLALNRKKSDQSFMSAFSEITHIHKLPMSKCAQYISIGVFFAFASGLIVTLIVSLFNNEGLLGSSANLEMSVLTGISVLLCAPIGEELLMRCFVHDTLKKYQSPQHANISQSILFGLLHGVSLQTIYTALIGLFMGNEVQKNKNLTCSLMIHFGFNLGAGLNCIFPTLGDFIWYNIGILVVSFCGFIFFTNILIQNRKANNLSP